jgi:hypothetical protein
MLAYEIYWRDPIKGYQLIGVLPERRKSPFRITQESVINLGRKILGKNVDVNDLFFIKIPEDKNTSKILRINSVYRPLKEFEKVHPNSIKSSAKYMLVYEFYWRDEKGGDHLIGILPERRKNLKRINYDLVVNWGKNVLGYKKDVKNIFFTKVKIDEAQVESWGLIPISELRQKIKNKSLFNC